MNLKKFLALALLSLGSALANVTPQWVSAVDLDGDNKPESIFTGNLADIAFNERGEVVAWYVKPIVGSKTIDVSKTPPNADLLKNQYKPKNDPLGHTLFSGQNGLVVKLLGTDKDAKPGSAQTPELTVEGDANRPSRMVGKFAYTQGSSIVQKTVFINPTRFTIETTISVNGDQSYELEFPGVGGSTKGELVANAKNSPSIVNADKVDNVNYAAITKSPPFWNPNDSGAIIVQPLDDKRIDAKLIPGVPNKLVLTLQGEQKLKIYGGRHELVRLQLEGYIGLPGLFEPNIWGRLSQGFMWLMNSIHGFVGSWFWTLVLLTILIRLAIWPLLHRQYLSTAEMQLVQPQLKELNEKFKDNPERRQQEMVKLYQEHKINPAAGCLPAIIQIPIFFIMWRVPYYYEFNEGFLWIPDLSLPDPFWVMPALYVAVNVLNLWISTRSTPEMFRQQVFIYLIIAFVALQFPSGAAVYFVVSTLIGVVQYLVINGNIKKKMELKNISKVSP